MRSKAPAGQGPGSNRAFFTHLFQSRKRFVYPAPFLHRVQLFRPYLTRIGSNRLAETTTPRRDGALLVSRADYSAASASGLA
jgi:hypothetical protein